MINYHGRQLGEEVLVRLASQGLTIQVASKQMDVYNPEQPAQGDEIIIVAKGDRYDILVGAQLLGDTNPNKPVAVKLISKQLLKRVEDLTLNGAEMAPPPMPREPDRYERPRYEDRPREFRPRPQGAPYNAEPKGGPYRPVPGNRPFNGLNTTMRLVQPASSGMKSATDSGEASPGKEIAEGFRRANQR